MLKVPIKEILRLCKSVSLLLLLGILSLFAYLYSLDAPYFFTDEILYLHAGSEYLTGDYERTMQSPMIPKFIVGFISIVTSTNVSSLRLPFALLGVASSIVVYFILLEMYKDKMWAFLGGMLYLFLPVTYWATRLVKPEAPLYFFWLLFHLMFLKYLRTSKRTQLWVAGLFIGLSVASKLPALILYPFSFLVLIIYRYRYQQKVTKSELINLGVAYLISGIVISGTYIHLFLTNGIEGLLRVPKAIRDVYITKSAHGKAHVIAQQVYQKSPWWTYFYTFRQEYALIHLILTALSPLIAFVERSFYSFYWLVFLLFSFSFYQVSGVKNARYISAMEIPLVFLVLIAIRHLFSICKPYKKLEVIVKSLIISILLAIGIIRAYTIITQEPTKYHALKLYIQQETHNFALKDRTYIFGSIKSSRWYTEDTPEDAIVFRRDFDIMCPDFVTFKYFAFDREEALKSPNNMLLTFVMENRALFDQEYHFGFDIYTLHAGAQPQHAWACKELYGDLL